MVLGLYDKPGLDFELSAFLSAFQVSFPILLDTGTTYDQYRQTGGTSPFPLDYVIDQTGRVAYHNTEYDPDAMTAVIDELLLFPSPVAPLPALSGDISLSVQPNPFNPRTVIKFDLPGSGKVDLDIHDTRGRLVRHLIAGEDHPAGRSSANWDGTDDHGRSLPSGLYLARIRTAGHTAITKLTLVR